MLAALGADWLKPCDPTDMSVYAAGYTLDSEKERP